MCALLYAGLEGDGLFRASMASGYASLLLLAWTLLLGPWRILRGAAPAVSTALRRAVGIWAGGLGALHSLVGLQVHMRGRPWTYFVEPGQAIAWKPRFDAFGAANDTGLAALLILFLLLSLSNHASLRRLGPKRWKRIQRWTYPLFALVLIHGLLYQAIESRPAPFVIALAAVAAAVAAAQSLGFWRHRRVIAR